MVGKGESGGWAARPTIGDSSGDVTAACTDDPSHLLASPPMPTCKALQQTRF